MRYSTLVIATLFASIFWADNAFSQMEVDGQILYGNEWIDYDKDYVKVSLDEDGLYRVSRSELAANGIPVNEISLKQLQIFNYGKEIPFYVDEGGQFIEFYGEKNRNQIDRFLYSADSLQLNPEFSLINDEAAYFISWETQNNNNVIEEIETDLSNNSMPPEPYYMHTATGVAKDNFYKPVLDGDNVRYSNFVASEGYGTPIRSNNSLGVSISHIGTTEIKSIVSVRFGGNNTAHRNSIKLNNTFLGITTSFRTGVISREYELNTSILEEGEALVNISSDLSEDDKNIMSVVKITYPRLFHSDEMDTYSITLEPSAIARYIEVDGYQDDLPIVYDLSNNQRIVPQKIDDTKVGFIVAASQEEIQIEIFRSESTIREAKQISARTFIDYLDENYNYLLLSSERLINNSSSDVVQQYADYRSSEEGGGYSPVVLEVEQLYDQYAYGVDKHCLAIRNYAYWAKENYNEPKYMFILGKGLEYWLYRKQKEINEVDSIPQLDFFVPTWGNPGSDNMLLASHKTHVPILPIGRFAAINTDQIESYLQKVKDHDNNKYNPVSIEARQWQKNVLHLSGGDNNIQQLLFNNLEVMRDTIESSTFGAKVSTFRKKSTDNIADALSEQIFDRINSGLSILTFFGHASVGAFDFNLDNVENYENKSKYPLLMSLGCYSGNIHSTNYGPQLGISESFVRAKDKGAIGFVAASGTAYIGVQNQFGRKFYSHLGNQDYGLPIGDALLNTLKDFENFQDYSYVTFYQQLTYHGDPAVILPNFRTPDVLPDPSTITTIPKFIDTYEEDFEVCFDVVNLGMYVNDSIDVLIQHQNPQGEIEQEMTRRIVIPAYSSNLCLTIPITSRELVGRNRILVKVDNKNEIEELPSPAAELNNTLVDEDGAEGFEFFILNNSAVPSFPQEFSIVNTEKVELIANTFNALGRKQDFIVELDTTMNFDSPSIKRRTFENIQAVLKWELDDALENETVYYWRVGSENTSTGETVWRQSSFIYEPGQREGWNQSHYFQFLENDFDNIEFKDSSREMKFVDNVKEIRMLNGIPGTGNQNEFYINASRWSKWRQSVKKGITIVLFDPFKGESARTYKDRPLYGCNSSAVPAAGWSHYLEYSTETIEDREKVINALRDSIPEDYVVAVNFMQNSSDNRLNIDEWDADSLVLGTTIFKELEKEGALKTIEYKETGPMPYIFVYEKGNSKVLSESYLINENEQLEVIFQIKSLWDEGTIKTDLIGPSISWDEIEWSVDYSEVAETDTVLIDVIGVKFNKEEQVLFEKISPMSMSLQGINANDYPYMKLKFFSFDQKELTTAQLKKLRVYFKGATDIALNPDEHFLFQSETLDEGEFLKFEMDVSNLSTVDMNDIDITYTIVDAENKSTLFSENINEIKKGETKRTTFELNTKGMVGDNIFQVQLNKDQTPMENYTFNNFGLTQFTVIPDTINPILEVTFDGVRIMQDDIVSANPMIRMELDDSNPFLLLNDASNFIISLTDPFQEETQISIDDPAINFIAAETGSDNKAIIEYNPELLEDGRYNLSVQSSDATGNTSGELKYEIDFRVFNQEMVSNVFNYPNPFSTSTQFIFTLTGSEEPGNILIRIMTLSGKVVREITSAELGDLRIGLNKTKYKWDGKDDFGERLANGTYLYQVITKKNDGSDYEKFNDPTQNNTDYLFKKGFGKLVILR